jgi:hypothetical protein
MIVSFVIINLSFVSRFLSTPIPVRQSPAGSLNISRQSSFGCTSRAQDQHRIVGATHGGFRHTAQRATFHTIVIRLPGVLRATLMISSALIPSLVTYEIFATLSFLISAAFLSR